MLIIGLMTPLLLSGCKTVHSSSAGLTVINYPLSVQQDAAKEMEIGACPVLNSFMNDYSVLRDQARVK